MSRVCPECGQPIAEHRLGVRLTPLKARIFDAIRRYGEERIKCAELGNPRTVKAHVSQINDLLEETDWRIDGRRGRDGGYRLVRRST
jgi:hypothetical protein